MSKDMRLLLISNSTNAGEEYLSWPLKAIETFLKGMKSVVFVPYAGVTFSYDEYVDKVQKRFSAFGVEVKGVHNGDPKKNIEDAEAIVVGGGNTWRLLLEMQENGLIEPIRQRVQSGTPYVGWSAGSNVTCPTIRTTNDMPIVEPHSFNALGLVPFQINPHYLDANPEGHAGETREDRIREFIELNREMYVVGLREGCYLEYGQGELKLVGERGARIFKYDTEFREVRPGDDLSFLLKRRACQLS